ncbi:HECT-domain-containing protein [Mycena chlorophos]|uniref:HECT-type E3 ubiquitin transferase n=1 Tax=Mycena chlorophos TaxID=658473 RepID=A0A8H6SKT2_MYCCL|nr:HECT-domain-containing protein [Mycena chlorophos]
MHPLFPDPQRRRINLGGVSGPTHASVLNNVQSQRVQRQRQKRETDAATRVQAAWRGFVGRRRVRGHLRSVFDRDLDGIDAMRVLVTLREKELLDVWVNAMLTRGEAQLFCSATAPHLESWSFLVRHIARLILANVARQPKIASMQLLRTLLTPAVVKQYLGDVQGTVFLQSLMSDLLRQRFYEVVSTALYSMSKTSPETPLLAQLCTAPFEALPCALQLLLPFLTNTLTIPLLPNLLPITSLTAFSAKIPSFSRWRFMEEDLAALSGLGTEKKVHLLANLVAFMQPRYPTLDSDSLEAYLALLTALLTGLPTYLLDPVGRGALSESTISGDDNSDDDEDEDAEPTQAAARPFTIDARTRKRVDTIPSTTHLSALLRARSSSGAASDSEPLINFVAVLVGPSGWPSKKQTVLGAVLGIGVGAGVGLGSCIAEIYRTQISGRSFEALVEAGRKPASQNAGPVNAAALMLLLDLFTQTLLTMGDDEFFAFPADESESSADLEVNASSSTQVQAQNPLRKEELLDLTRGLMRLVLALYFSGDARPSSEPLIRERKCIAPEVKRLRSKAVRFLLAVHARDSRRSFLPEDHWHAKTERYINLKAFVEVAAREEAHVPQADATDRERAYFAPRLAILHAVPFALPFRTRAAVFQMWSSMLRAFRAERHWQRQQRVPLQVQQRRRQQEFRWPQRVVGRAYRDGHVIEVAEDIPREEWAPEDERRLAMDLDLDVAPPPVPPPAPLRNPEPDSEGVVKIRRDHVAEDGFAQLKDMPVEFFHGPFAVAFVDKLGMPEGNVGHLGLYKEFFTAICKEVFRPGGELGLWVENEKHEIYPNPASSARTSEKLEWFRFIGRIVGKALHDGILIDFAFAGFFLAKWLGRQVYLDDLASLDPSLYRGLLFLKHYTGDVEDLSLNFTADVDDEGTLRTVDLMPDGGNTTVTKANRLQYIYLIAHLRLSWQIKPQSEAFFRGLSDLIEPRWLKMFNQQELQTLLGGADVDTGIDVDDLRANTDYQGVFHPDHATMLERANPSQQPQDGRIPEGLKPREHPTIVIFWNVVKTFNPKELRALLHFVTSCSRPPLLGFKNLHPHFTIQDMGLDTEDHLPAAATCSNLLLLPRYTDEAVLKEKLLCAIMSESGF